MRSSGRGVPMMDRERVPIRVLEDRLLADTAVDRLRDELDATRLELCLGGVVVVDVELERRGVRAEVDIEGIDLHQRDRHGPGLELAGRHLAPLLPEGQPESLAVELPCGLPVLRREGDEVDAVEQLCVGCHGLTFADPYGNPACRTGALTATTCPVRGPLPTLSGPLHSWASMNRLLPSGPPSTQAKQPRSCSTVSSISPPSATRTQRRCG